MSAASSKMVWLRRVLWVLRGDNNSAIQSANNPVHYENMRHIDVDCRYIREIIFYKTFTIKHMYSHDQLADVFTKAITRLWPNSFSPNYRFVILRFNLWGMLD